MHELTPVETRELANQLLLEHGLLDWKIEFNDSRRFYGQCWTNQKRIVLSRRAIFKYGFKETRDTILHEIAHALSPKRGHGKEWRDIAYKIGVRDYRHGRYNLNKAVRERSMKAGV